MNAETRRETAPPQVATAFGAVMWLASYGLLFAAIVVSGLKPIGISADIRNYELLYNASAINSWKTIFSEGDFGYFALAKFAASIGWSFDVFAFAIAAITCILLFIVAKRLDTNRPVLVAAYASYLFWLHEYTQIRIAAAMAIGLFAIYVARPSVKWPLLVLAVLLHNSFVLLIGAYMLVRVRRIDVLVGLVILSLILFLGPLSASLGALIQRVVNYRDLASTGQFTSINLFSLMPLVQIAGVGCAVWHFRQLTPNAREETVFSAAGVVAFYAMSSVPVLAFRTFELFMPFFVILLSRLWRISIISRCVVLIWILLGLRSSFFTPDSVVIM